jgi:nucleotide-binding universal stress UspA family protein
MTPTIIIDFHDTSRGMDALALARSLAGMTGARLVTVTSYVHDRFGMLPVREWRWATPAQTQAAAELANRLMADEPGAITRLIGATSPARALHKTAEREQADLIVIAPDDRGEHGGVTAGATGRQAVQGAPCAVALAPPGFADSDRSLAPVGVAFDGSVESRLALSSAAGLADSMNAELRIVSVLERPTPAPPMFAFSCYHALVDQLREQAQSRLQGVLDALPVHPAAQPLVVEGEPAGVLLDHADELGLLVVGSRAYGPLRRVLLGSVSNALLDGAACPVMIIPRGAERAFGVPILHARPAHSH